MSGRAAIGAVLACGLAAALLIPAAALGDHPGAAAQVPTISDYVEDPLPPIPRAKKQALPRVPKAGATDPWPPIPEGGAFFVHYGEEHWNDLDGLRILPRVVADTARYGPDLVTMSGDKANDGNPDELQGWKSLMQVYDQEGIPYFAGVGNHDREARPGFQPGIDPMGDFGPYMNVFADRPYPFGDAPPIDDPRFSPQQRPASDPAGASSHYALEYGPVRWVFLDNGCFGIINCDPFQNPSFPDAEGNQGQYDFLATEAAKANAQGDLLFVVMHMPTQDDRPMHSAPTPFPHTMGEGSSPDNALFEQEAAAAGVDAVLVAHIKGQWEYSAQGVAYYTDGGAGGEVYVGPAEDTGVDSGYWHGYRLIHVKDGHVTTDTVPIFAPAGITVNGTDSIARGEIGEFSAVANQPTEDGPKVTALELREPDPSAPNASTLPTPAHIWTSGNPLVLAPVPAGQTTLDSGAQVASASLDDPRRDPRTQTTSGRFAGLCPGRTEVAITSGWESQSTPVTVPSQPGPIVNKIKHGKRKLGPGQKRKVAKVRLAQPAQVRVVVKRHGREVRTLAEICHESTDPLKATWNGRANGKRVKPGRYAVLVTVESDQPPVKKKFKIRVTG
jgi:Calcineurin-like phosphoesterase